MNARRLAKTAALIAASSEKLISSPQLRKRFDAEAYWKTCEKRLQCWNRALAMFKEDLREGSDHSPWPALAVVGEEILYSEVLTRIWTAVLSISDRDQNDREMDAILRAIWIGHLAARNQVLVLIYKGQQQGIEAAANLDRQRRRLERWTDILLSRFAHLGDVEMFCFDPERVGDWSKEHRQLQAAEYRQQWNLLVASFQKSLGKGNEQQAANPDLNRQLVVTIAACIPEGQGKERLEESIPWLARMTETAEQMESLINEYIAHAS